MGRFFYTDPLAAAWMAKHFGMRFCDRAGYSVSANPALWYMADRHHQAASLLIHPDSLHLLEPKKGDKVSYSFGAGSHAGEAWDEVIGVVLSNDERYPYTGNGEPFVLVNGPDAFPLSRLKSIFQRNGIPFMWPEVEP